MPDTEPADPPLPPDPRDTAPAAARARLPERLLPLLFPLLALLLLGEVLTGGRVLLPAEYLQGMSPWIQGVPDEVRRSLPQWNALQWDAMAEFYPWRLHAARAFAAGQVPLWNPYVLCGTPFLANSQSAPLYPLHLLYYLPLGASAAARMGWVAFVHLSLAGLFAWWLCRDQGARPLAALIGGAAYELSGFAVAWLQLPTFLGVACWIPCLLVCTARAVRTGSWKWIAAGGAAGGMMLLAGHLQIAFYGLLAAGAVWAWETASRLLAARRSPSDARAAKPWLSALGAGLGIVLLAFALSAPQVLPSLELSRMSHRAGTPTEAGYASYVSLAMPLQNWVTLLVPDYYGLPARGTFWGMWAYLAPNVMEYAGHIGPAAFLLALVGLVWGRRVTPRVRLWALLALFALLLASGSVLCRLFYFYVPGFAQSGSPARSLVLFCLAQAVLAGLGTEWLLRQAEGREGGWTAGARTLGIALALTLSLVAGLHFLAQGALAGLERASLWSRTAEMGAISQSALTVALACAAIGALLPVLMLWLLRENPAAARAAGMAGALLAVAAGSLAWLGRDYLLTAPPGRVYPGTPLTAALARNGARVATLNRHWPLDDIPRALLPPNASIAYGWRDAQGYDSLYLARFRALANALAGPEGASPPTNGNIVFIKNAESPLLPLLACRYLVSQAPLSRAGLQPAPGFPPGPPYVYEDRLALPEAYLADYWTVAEDGPALEQLARRLPRELARTAVLAPGPGTPAALDAGPPASEAPAPVTVTRRGPGAITLEANPSAPSILVLSEAYAAGWRARIRSGGGPAREVRPMRVNVAFQGVAVGPGPVVVELRYEPATFRAGLFSALLALAGLLAACCSQLTFRRRVLRGKTRTTASSAT